MDKYDEAVAILTNAVEEEPGEIIDAWEAPGEHFAGCLFQYVNSNGYEHYGSGCLTQIRKGTHAAQTKELTHEIQEDTRIPKEPGLITPADLPVFAEWQRRLDQELRNRPSG